MLHPSYLHLQRPSSMSSKPISMTIAGRMLLESTTPVGDIGETVGYQSEAAFQRVFKKQIGVTPARWRSSGGHMQAAQDSSEDAAPDDETTGDV